MSFKSSSYNTGSNHQQVESCSSSSTSPQSSQGSKGFLTSSNRPTTSGTSSHMRLGSLSRAEKSLTALTTKFMKLLQDSNNGVLDLRSVIQPISLYIKLNRKVLIFVCTFCLKVGRKYTFPAKATCLRYHQCSGRNRAH